MKKRAVKTITAAVILTAAGVLYYIFVSLTGLSVPCLFRKVTGLYCPGCGVTGMLISIIRLDFCTAFWHNPVLFVLLPFIIYIIGRLIYGYIRRGSLLQSKFDKILTFVIIGILLVYWVVRNLPPFGVFRLYE